MNSLAFICILATVTNVADAYPNYSSTDISTYAKGGPFGKMGISNFENEYDPNKCKISHNVPPSGYVAGTSYTFQVETRETGGLGMKIKVGTITKDTESNRKAFLDAIWTPQSGTAPMDIFAICGAGGNYKKMWVAQKVTVFAATSTHHSTTGTPEEHSTTYPHHSTTSSPHSTTLSYAQQQELKCHYSNGEWHWEGPNGGWCKYPRYATTTSTGGPEEHSTTLSFAQQQELKCHYSNGEWHWEGPNGGWCKYPRYATTTSAGGPEAGGSCKSSGGYCMSNQECCSNSCDIAMSECNPSEESSNPYAQCGQQNNKDDCDAKGCNWKAQMNYCEMPFQAKTGFRCEPYLMWCESPQDVCTMGEDGENICTLLVVPPGQPCRGARCCDGSTEWNGSRCVPTYSGVMDACHEVRGEWGWTCEQSCAAV